MAADSAALLGDTKVARMRKVRRIRGGLVGCAGHYESIVEFWNWLVLGAHEDEFPKCPPGHCFAIVVDPERRVTMWEGSSYSPMRVTDPYCAIGSGQDFALGAMAAGASAKDAVKAAIAHHSKVSGPVRVYKLK